MARTKRQSKTEPKSEEEMRKDLYRIAKSASDRVYDLFKGRNISNYPDFTEREDLAEILGKEFGEYVLKESMSSDPKFQKIMDATTLPCPDCQTLCPRAKDPEGKPIEEKITVKTKVGEFPFAGPLFRCAKCRRNFSPLKAHFEAEQ